MRILALNSSPRKNDESYTVMMLNQLVDGMREAGADVEVINLREKKIKNCIGCFSCWTKTPGKCIQKDDMTNELFPKWLACDLVVYASPLYFHTVNANMSAFLERRLPAALPFFEEDAEGKTTHPLRFKFPDSVLLTVCGFPEISEFDALLEFLDKTSHKDSHSVAAICRAGASLLTSPFLQKESKDILAATKLAGKEIVELNKITPETMTRITKPLGNVRSFAQMGNMFWQTCIDESITPREFDDRKMVPRPKTLADFMFVLPFGLNSKAAAEKKMVLQFDFSGKVKDVCHFIIDQGRATAKRGSHENPDITIESDFDIWIDIMTRKADGSKMFMEQKCKVHGDLMLMMQLFQKENNPVIE